MRRRAAEGPSYPPPLCPLASKRKADRGPLLGGSKVRALPRSGREGGWRADSKSLPHKEGRVTRKPGWRSEERWEGRGQPEALPISVAWPGETKQRRVLCCGLRFGGFRRQILEASIALQCSRWNALRQGALRRCETRSLGSVTWGTQQSWA